MADVRVEVVDNRVVVETSGAALYGPLLAQANDTLNEIAVLSDQVNATASQFNGRIGIAAVPDASIIFVGPSGKAAVWIDIMGYLRGQVDGDSIVDFTSTINRYRLGGLTLPDILAVRTDINGKVNSALTSWGQEVQFAAPVPLIAPAQHARSGHGFNQVADTMWSWWIGNSFIRDVARKRTYLAGIGSSDPSLDTFSPIEIAQSTDGSIFENCTIGRMKAANNGTKGDDHSAGDPVMDTRRGARYPLIVFQSDHGQTGSTTQSNVRMWRSKTGNNEDLFEGPLVTFGGGWSYAQFYRRTDAPDTIVGMSRQGVGDDGVSTWWLVRSANEGESWTRVPLFTSATGGLYGTMKPTLDGTGVHFIFYTNPSASADLQIVHHKMTWDGVLTSTKGGSSTVVVANVWAQTVAINPHPTGLVIATPSAGGNRRQRLHDFLEISTNVIHTLDADFNNTSPVSDAKYRYTVSDVGAGTTSTEIIDTAGVGFSGSNPDYMPGGAITGSYVVTLARKQADGNNRVAVYRKPSGSWVASVVDSVANGSKAFIRPLAEMGERWDATANRIVRAPTGRVVYLKGSYTSFYVFLMDAFTFNVGDFA